MSGFRSARQRAFARSLRANMTEAERRLWYHLRGHRLAGLSVRRQAPVGPFIVDFLIPSVRLVIELDGGQHAESLADLRRDALLRALGYRTLRFWNDDVLARPDAVLEAILAALPETRR